MLGSANEVGWKWAGSGPEPVHFGPLLGRPYFGPLTVHFGPLRPTSAHFCATPRIVGIPIIKPVPTTDARSNRGGWV